MPSHRRAILRTRGLPVGAGPIFAKRHCTQMGRTKLADQGIPAGAGPLLNTRDRRVVQSCG
eukprot:345414-Karenia_brevis.AAC.1